MADMDGISGLMSRWPNGRVNPRATRRPTAVTTSEPPLEILGSVARTRPAPAPVPVMTAPPTLPTPGSSDELAPEAAADPRKRTRTEASPAESKPPPAGTASPFFRHLQSPPSADSPTPSPTSLQTSAQASTFGSPLRRAHVTLANRPAAALTSPVRSLLAREVQLLASPGTALRPDRLYIGAWAGGAAWTLVLATDCLTLTDAASQWPPLSLPVGQLVRIEYHLAGTPRLLAFTTEGPLPAGGNTAHYTPGPGDQLRSRLVCLFENESEARLTAWVNRLAKMEGARSPQRLTAGAYSYLVQQTECVGDQPSLPAESPVSAPDRADWSPAPLLVYPFNGIRSVTLTARDLPRLSAGEFLNDTIIEFYLKILQEQLQVRDTDLAGRVHVFNSFFYTQLTARSTRELDRACHSKVRRWTAKLDLFAKRLLVIPIHEEAHWYLAVICNPGAVLTDPVINLDPLPPAYPPSAPATPSPTTHPPLIDLDITTPPTRRSQRLLVDHDGPIVISPDVRLPTSRSRTRPRKHLDPENSPFIAILDSLGARHASAGRILNAYLAMEATARGVTAKRKADVVYPVVPYQTNHCDCGVFILQYVETLLGDPDRYLRRILLENWPRFIQLLNVQTDSIQAEPWFPQSTIAGKRPELQALIDRLAVEYRLYRAQLPADTGVDSDVETATPVTTDQ
ncbi:hypothetical protein IWQ60_011531 [Tieghemiomyces parasiticus]|uniref:Ubiquitin-like protease family profile domain-containing protein n=1 Tax=Tieghemiomyces parasiticus TaxID=78921 RepID=A0A9W7ZGZ0_9FUNG|nr:hypothetical protein IWQ60_011531 [Tieghemiomyces parasiticus]